MGRAWRILAALASAAALGACIPESFDPGQLPEALRGDYAVFAQRCSRCHSLARPLNASVDDDIFWRRYVEQMRLKPGSGISVADETPILRFLHYYMLQRRARASGDPADSTAAPVSSEGAP